MARKIIRDADREKAREESKKAAEAVPVVKPTSTEVDKTKLSFPKPGKIKSISDLDQFSYSALQGATAKVPPYSGSWHAPKPQPPDFTINDMLKFTGCAVPGEGDKYRTDGVIVGHGFIYATDLKCSLRVSDLCMVDFDLFAQVNGDVIKGDSPSGKVVGYMNGKAGCNGTDLETPPMGSMPWVAVGETNWSITPLSTYNTQPIIRAHKCPSCNGGFVSMCPACKGIGCKSCNSKGGTKCVFCTDGTLNTIVGYRYITPNKPGEFILSPEYHNRIQSLPDVGVYPAKVKGILGFDFRVNKDQRGKGICVTMDEPKMPGTYVSPKEVFGKMLSGSGGSVGKTNTSAAEFAKAMQQQKLLNAKVKGSPLPIEMIPYNGGPNAKKSEKYEIEIPDGLLLKTQTAAELDKEFGIPDHLMFGPSTIMGGMANKPKPKLPKMED